MTRLLFIAASVNARTHSLTHSFVPVFSARINASVQQRTCARLRSSHATKSSATIASGENIFPFHSTRCVRAIWAIRRVCSLRGERAVLPNSLSLFYSSSSMNCMESVGKARNFFENSSSSCLRALLLEIWLFSFYVFSFFFLVNKYFWNIYNL